MVYVISHLKPVEVIERETRGGCIVRKESLDFFFSRVCDLAHLRKEEGVLVAEFSGLKIRLDFHLRDLRDAIHKKTRSETNAEK